MNKCDSSNQEFNLFERFISILCLWLCEGKLHLRPNLSMLCALSQIINTVLKNNIGILKQIV